MATVDLALNVNEPRWGETKHHHYAKASAIRGGQRGFFSAVCPLFGQLSYQSLNYICYHFLESNGKKL